jgi:hypothetical protein
MDGSTEINVRDIISSQSFLFKLVFQTLLKNKVIDTL